MAWSYRCPLLNLDPGMEMKETYDRIIDSVFNKKELLLPRDPPENPHEVDMDKRREKAERAKLRAERERMKVLEA